MHLLREKLGQTAVENPNEERRHEAHLISLSHCHVRLAIEALNESIVLGEDTLLAETIMVLRPAAAGRRLRTRTPA